MPSSPHEGWNNAPYLPGISREPGGQLIGTSKRENTLAQGSDFSFSDVLDAVNPLHHLPIISTMYRNVTGDGLSSLAKLAGSALFFGPLGLKIAAADVAVQAITGSSVEQHILSLFDNDSAQGDISPSAEHQTAKITPEKNTPQPISQAHPDGTQEHLVFSSPTDVTVDGHMSLAQQTHQRIGHPLYSSLSHPVSALRTHNTPRMTEFSDTHPRTQVMSFEQTEHPTDSLPLASKVSSPQVRSQNSDTIIASPPPYVAAKTLEELVERYTVSETRMNPAQGGYPSPPRRSAIHDAVHNEHHLPLNLKAVQQAAARYRQTTHRNTPKAGYNL